MPPRQPQMPRDRAEATLRAMLAGDRWQPGDQLPSVPDLAAELQVGHGTLRAVLAALASEGLVTILPRYGTFKA